MDEKVLKEEQKHLSEVYQQLLMMKVGLEERSMKLDQAASEEKNDIRDNLRFDTADDEVKTEMYAEIETWNRYIDSYNVQSGVLRDKLKKVGLLLDSPYFARVTLQFEPDEEPESYYIGRAAVSEKDGTTPIVIDWRSPIAETYYNQDNGKTYYTVDGRRIDVDLLLRRQFDLEKDQLKSYFDTSVAIEDPMLLRSLSARRTDKMQAITVTIQKEQNTVIRYPDVPVLLVNGIAGSGKTSVLLQRIAYLFYHKRKTLRPENVVLLTLNPIFAQYISGVLPDLGEQNPTTETWQEFLASAKVPVGGPGYDTKAESLRLIDEKLSELKLEEEDLKPVTQKGTRILGRGQIYDIIGQYSSRIPLGVRLVQVVTEDLIDRTTSALRRRMESAKREEKENGYDTSFDASADSDEAEEAREQEKEERRLLSISDADMTAKEENALLNDNGGAFKTIREYGWLNIERIGCRLLGKDHLTSIEWLYLKMALTGQCDRMAQYVMIDEVQDYTESQLMTLARFYPTAKFMLLGDEFQSIHESNITFERIHTLFDGYGRKVTELPLKTSYRSSPEITEIFAGLLPEEQKLMAKSVQRPGTEPVIQGFSDESSYTEALRGQIKDAAERAKDGGLAAVVCINRRSLRAVQGLLGADAPQHLSGEKSLPKSGVFMIELADAKGLEFDTVIIPDATAQNYPVNLLARHRLYTAVSRATERLIVLSDGPMTKLLPAGAVSQSAEKMESSNGEKK